MNRTTKHSLVIGNVFYVCPGMGTDSRVKESPEQ